MRARSNQQVPAYDPFGEPVEAGRGCAAASGDRPARNAAVAVFWGLALLLVGGRIYLGDQPVQQVVASAQAQVAALVTAIR
ncbi:hypothetical protein [Methylobacterium sp. A54F]